MFVSYIISIREKNKYLRSTVILDFIIALHHQDRPKKMIE